MSDQISRAELRAAIEDVLYGGALALDELRFTDWLELTAPEFRYRIHAYSPDLRKDMKWLDYERAGIEGLIELLPRHHVDGASWLRHVVLYSLTPDGPDAVRTSSSLAVFHTRVDVGDAHLQGGSSHVFTVGRYNDRFRLDGGKWLLAERTVRLDTRQFGVGSHLFP